MSILTTTLKQEEQAKAVQTHDVLELAAEHCHIFEKASIKIPAKSCGDY